MKKRERLLFVGMVFALGLPIFANNKQDLLKQARDDYYKTKQETINQNKAKEKLEQKKKLEEEKAAKEKKRLEEKKNKEQKLAEEKAAKEKKKLEEKNAKEQKLADEKVSKEQKKAEEKAQVQETSQEVATEETNEVTTTDKSS